LKHRLAACSASIGAVKLGEMVREDVERLTSKSQVPRHDYLDIAGNQHGQFFFRRREGADRKQDRLVERYRELGGELIPPSQLSRLSKHFDQYDEFLRGQSVEAQRDLRRRNTTSYLAKFGLEVSSLKDGLHRLGFYNGPIDDEYREDVAEALAKFQASCMMRQVDGFFGELTYQQMVRMLVERGFSRWQ
jgi:hypothetical protein